MSPASSTGVASFSFCIPAQKPTTQIPTSTNAPSSDLLRCSGNAKTSSDPNCIATLPKVLIQLVKTWLIDKELLALILSSHHMHNEVQGLYLTQLRDEVAKQGTSPFALCQNTVNLRPALVGLGKRGEQMFQKFLSMKASGIPGEQVSKFAVQYLTSLVSKLKNPKYEVEQLRELVTAATLALGGTMMSAAHRDALMCMILRTSKIGSHEHMGAMIRGLCAALGPTLSGNGHHRAVCEQILASHKTSSPIQMGSMTGALASMLGGVTMPQHVRIQLTAMILNSYLTCTPQQMRAMLYCLSLALGGRNMKPGHRCELMQQVLDFHDDHSTLRLDATMQALCAGLVGTDLVTEGHDMQRQDVDAVLTQILGRSKRWDPRKMGTAIAELCWCLKLNAMSGANRDYVLARILASSTTSRAAQMGTMMQSVCTALGGRTPGAGANQITRDNLEAMLRQIMAAQQTCSWAQLAAMIYGLVLALGGTGISAAHSAMLASHIQQSERAPDIVAAIKLTPGGSTLLELLHLNHPDSVCQLHG